MLKIWKRQKALLCYFFSAMLVLVGLLCFQSKESTFTFVKVNPQIEVNTSFDALANIKAIKEGKKTAVVVDSHQLNTAKVGKYPVIYTYLQKRIEIMVTVVDSKAPTFTIKEIEIDLGMKVDPKEMVENIEDASEVNIYFASTYSFNRVGDVKVTVVVEDSSGNKTAKDSVVHVLSKDREAPVLEGVKDIHLQKDGTIDFLVGIKVHDNRDPNPLVSVNTKKLNVHKLGVYPIVYEAKDRSGNCTRITCTVTVIPYKEIGTSEPSDEKIIYLTFDDGPSKYTKQILDILDRYDAKASFFVTGTNPEYFDLLKEIDKRGHTIGLHTYSHNYDEIYASVKNYYDDLDQVAQLCHQQVGYIPKYIRFPGGSSNEVSRQYNVGIMSVLSKDVLKKGYQYYDWDISSGDGKGKSTANQLIKNATESKADNIMILFHDANGKQATVQALPSVLKYYHDLGYRFAKITDNSYVPHHTIHN